MKTTILKSIILSLALMAGVNSVWAGQKTIFLKPNSNWTQSNAWFSVYCYNNGEEWVKMADNDGDGTYECFIDDKFTSVIFCRMNPASLSTGWGNKWDQTNDLTITDGSDLYTVAAGAWSNGKGTWSAFTLSANKTIYLKPNDGWKSDGARFAVYAFNASGSKWYDLNNVDCNGDFYSCTIDKAYHTVIFCRMNGSNSTNSWENVYNQTGNIILLNNGKNTDQFNITDWGAGTWSTYATPSYTVTLIADSHGTYNVTYSGTTVTSKLDANVEVTVPFNTNITITSNTPKPGYAQTHGAHIKIGNQDYQNATLGTEYTVCGTTTITGNFVSAKEQKVYLQPTTIWATKDAVEAYRAYVFHDSGNKWLDATAVSVKWTDGSTHSSGDNVQEYEFSIPAGYHSVIFCRVKDKNVSNFNDVNFWNKTNDLLIPVGQPTNCCKITKMGEKPTPESEPENCESLWKVRTHTITLYASNFGEYGLVYDNLKYPCPASGSVVYEFPQNASIKTYSSPYNEAYRGDLMMNQGGNRTILAPNAVLTLNCPTVLDDNYVTTGSHVVYLGVPDNTGDWNRTSGTNYAYAFNNRTTYFPEESERVQMTLVEKTNDHDYFKCIVPAGYNSLRFEKDGTLDSKTVNLRTKDLAYSIPVNEMNCYTLGGKENGDNTKFYGGWDAAPAFNGDYRLLHMRDTATYTSRAVRKYIAPRDLLQLDTISMHIYTRDLNTKNHTLQWQQYNSSEKVWENIGAAKNVGDIATIMNDPKDDGCGVWNFVVTQQSNGATTIDLDNPHRYTGKYYIRTNNAEGGWLNYAIATNLMTYSSYAKAHSGYTHYYCRWVDIKDGSAGAAGKNHNVKFNIANEHGYGISKILAKDDHTASGGILPESANVRWAWDEVTNTVSRAYILGSGEGEGINHLVVDYKPNSSAQQSTITKLSDKENWIYEIDLKNVTNGSVLNALAATYPSENKTITVDTKTETIQPYTQTFISNKNMITSGNQTPHNVRVMYDFKTNQTSVMLIPDETNVHVGIDVLIERQDQADATQVSSEINAANDEGYTVYAAMTFSKDHILNDALTAWNRLYYWVSFPFDVKISDVFGFGEYGKQWIIQYYDGAARAKNGYYLESPTYWRWISDTTYNANADNEDSNGNPSNGVMVANRGYILQLAANVASEATFQNNSEYVRLYFPSMEKIKHIDGNMQEVTSILDPYICNISGREAYDSHWHIIGVPSYANKNVNVTQKDLFFFYEYDASNNTYSPQSSDVSPAEGVKSFKSMHSYMVQYAGEINWSATTSFEPKQLAARRNADYEENVYNLGLQLLQNGQTLDQTFIRMQEDNATADFDMNLDLTKIINSGANIYSLAGEEMIELAGNVLPVEDAVVPLGVVCAQAGNYTFSMPAGTADVVVELIDYVENTCTNLLLSDYVVSIPAGTHKNRFALSVKPSKVVTSVESTTDDAAAGLKKYIINGQLIIQHDGQLYNAMGEKL